MALALLLPAVLFLVDPAAFEPASFLRALLLFLGPLCLMRSALAGSLRDRASEPLPPAFLALGLLLLLTLVTGGTAGPGIAVAAERLLLLLVTLYAAADAWRRPARLPAVLLASGAGAALLALAQALGADPLFDNPAREAVATLGNTNRAAEFLAPVLVLACGLSGAGRGALGWLARIALPLLAAAVVLTGSRAALVACCAAGAAAWLLGGRRFAARAALPAAALILVGVALAAGIGGAAVLGFKKIAEAPASVASPEYPTNKQRWLLLSATARMVDAAPWFGHGAGAFRAEFPPYRDPEEAAIETLGGARSQAEDPHDQYLLLAAESGVPAALCLLAFVLLALFAGGARELPEGDPRRALSGPLRAAFATMAILLLFRSSLTTPPAAVAFFALGGALLAPRLESDPARPDRLRDRAVVPLALLLLLAIGARALYAQLQFGRGLRGLAEVVEHPNSRTADRVARAFAAAAAAAPDDLDLLQLRASVLDSLSKRDARFAGEAESARALLLRANPWHRPGLIAAAAADLQAGRVGRARRHLARALYLDGVASPFADGGAAAAALLLQAGRGDAAAALLADAVRRGELEPAALRARFDAAAADLAHGAAALAYGAALERAAPLDGDAAYRLGELHQAAGRATEAGLAFGRAHVAFALEHLAAGRYADAKRSAGLAARQGAPDAACLELLADCGAGRAGALEELRAVPPPGEPLRAALSPLARVPALAPALAIVLRR